MSCERSTVIGRYSVVCKRTDCRNVTLNPCEIGKLTIEYHKYTTEEDRVKSRVSDFGYDFSRN